MFPFLCHPGRGSVDDICGLTNRRMEPLMFRCQSGPSDDATNLFIPVSGNAALSSNTWRGSQSSLDCSTGYTGGVSSVVRCLTSSNHEDHMDVRLEIGRPLSRCSSDIIFRLWVGLSWDHAHTLGAGSISATSSGGGSNAGTVGFAPTSSQNWWWGEVSSFKCQGQPEVSESVTIRYTVHSVWLLDIGTLQVRWWSTSGSR